MARRILKLNDRKALQAGLSGGKGRGLACLTKYGYSVPSGFIITVPAFKEILEFNRISLTGYASLNEARWQAYMCGVCKQVVILDEDAIDSL